jgi:hypothetical protein
MKSLFVLTAFILLANSISGQNTKDKVNGNLIQFNDNGAWCWYQDERAIVDPASGRLIIGSVGNSSGVGGSPRNGDIEVVFYDLMSATSSRFTLAEGGSNFSGSDDHNAPAFLIRPDGKYLTFYAGHNNNNNSYYRIYNNGTWGTQQVFDWNARRPGGVNFATTYSNLFYLSSEGRTYNIARGNNKSPNIMTSTDNGDNWTYGGQLTSNANIGYVNGYLKYCSNGVDRVDFICTEYHPRDYNTSIYHGYFKNGKSYKSDGTLVDGNILDTLNIPTPTDFTKVFAANTVYNGIVMTRCWNLDVQTYGDGTVATIIKARANDLETDHRFFYCRYDGTSWTYTYLGKAGSKLYSSEQDYTGLAALHPNNPNIIYISTTFDPRDSSSLGVHEIFKGVTSDHGATWTWTPITKNSVRDNLRPIIPLWDVNKTALLWLRGTYSSAQIFDAAVVGIIESTSDTARLMRYVDASSQNTTLADGSPLVTTGPDSNAGPADSKWHLRTSYGNKGTVLTSAETGGENAPTLKTTVTVAEAGSYDVWVNFWGSTSASADWRIKAGFNQNEMQQYRQMACKQVDVGAHDSTIVLSGNGNTFLYQAYIGRVLVTGNSISVYIDDEAIKTGTQSTLVGDVARTWYDGISYAKISSSLPVELTNFTGRSNGSEVLLSWSTRTETNNKGFEIEKLINSNWADIGFVQGKGTSTDPSEYSFRDIVDGVSSLYRLKQVDYNGTVNYSESIKVISSIDFRLGQNYPNPFNPSTTISYSLPENNFVTLKVYNTIGEEVAVLVNKQINAGVYKTTWDAHTFPSGIYIYRLTIGSNSKVKKMALVK